MAVDDYSTTPASNTTISGINIAENCPPGNLNNAIRQMMADVKGLQGTIPSTTSLMPKDGGTFEGTQPKYTGRGAYRHNNSAALSSGREYFLADGSSYPSSPTAGDVVNFYTS